MPHERSGIRRDAAALLLDGLLARVARGRGALDIAIGEALEALGTGDRVIQLSFSGIGDYARERLGIGASTALKMVRLARELRERPLLRAAVRAGEVSARKALVVLPVARGDEEESWVARARARSGTVRALAAAVKAARAAEPPEEDEPWERICVQVSAAARPVFDEAMALAEKILGATAPRWQRLQAICEEFLGTHPDGAPREAGTGGVLRGPVADWLEEVKEWLEKETAQWALLDEVEPVVAPAAADEGKTDALLLDEQLRQLSRMRDSWDEVFGHLAMLFQMLALWRDAGFASFGHYCGERLGMGQRTVEQRVWLERRLHALPALRRAIREGRVSYEKARVVAEHADDRSVEDLIRRAERMTCIELRRELDAGAETQMWARGELELRAPVRVGTLLDAALRAARAASDRWLAPSECLERIARHFVDTWKPVLAERSTPQKKVLARDRGFCQVPGCSRAAAHVHHVVYRSAGGGDDARNLVSLCAVHHLHSVHKGWIRVSGEAPDRLHWELGVRPGAAPLMEVWTTAR